MKHRKKKRILDRPASARVALLRSLVRALFERQRIETTVAKAKEARRVAEKLITTAKEDTVHARRLARKFLNDRQLVWKLFHEIAPRYKEREGGYTRIIRVGQRRGDGAEMAILELVE